ncbi:hypothetical protein EDD16DRAFT_1530659 [Pisolithus croceorrhizus]|nr:hypothetical protein EDD16DRAFT_1530659 [Pisolithus croceorrhizus]
MVELAVAVQWEGPAEAPRRAHLYVGNLSPRVTEYMLTEIFAVAGPVQHVKIIPDRNYPTLAKPPCKPLNGRKIFDTEIRVNWAYQGSQNKEDTVCPEVNDDVLAKAFNARVMWDMNSGKSRGYGFLAFRDKTDAEQAIATMNGEWLGSRAIRVNWANQKTQGAAPTPRPAASVGTAPAPINFQGGPLSYESVVQQTPSYNTTVYVGNLVPYCTQADLIPLFQSIGYLSEIRMQADRGFAFGQMVHGRPIKCSWGKDRADGATVQPGALTPSPTAAPYGNMPMYGMPQPSTYGQYGFAPGVPQPGAGAVGTGLGAGQSAADPAAAAGAAAGAQAQWPTGDPSYYSNYWGGYYGQQAQQGPDGQGA